MKKSKEVKPLNKRLESFVIGLFLILLSLMLGLNVGKVARTLAFPLIYFFGGAYYLILGYLVYRGIMRIILGKSFKYKNAALKAGLIFFFIASIFLIDYVMFTQAGFTFNQDVGTLVSSYNAGLGNYYTPIYLNVFEVGTYWSGGLIGVLLGSIFASNEIVLTLAIILFVIAFLLILMKPLTKLIAFIFKKGKESGQKHRQERKERDEKKEQERKRIEEEERQRLIEEEKVKVVQEPKEEKVEIQFGFEPESFSFEESNTGFNQLHVGSSLDDSYTKGRYKDENFSEFFQLSFTGEQRKIVVDSSDEFKRNSYFDDDQEQNVEEKKQEIKEEEVKIDLHNDEEIKVVVNETEPKIDLDFEPEIEIKLDDEEKKDEEIIEIDPVYEEKPIIDLDSEYEPKIVEEEKEEFVQVQIEQEPIKEEIKEEQPLVEEKKQQEIIVEEVKVEEKPKKRERVNWVPPSSEMLEVIDASSSIETNHAYAEKRVELLNRILEGFKVGARCIGYTLGNNFTRFNIEYEPNVSVRSVEKLVNDISMRLGGVSIRFVPYVSGEMYSGLEVSNPETTTVAFKEIFDSLPDVNKHPLAVGFGKDLSGNVVSADFNEFPHLLVAGTTGSGKSIYIHSIISTLIMRTSPDDLKIVLVDPKKVEMVKYRDMPHLLCPIITEANKAKVMLSKLVEEMEKRYELFSDTNGEVSNIKEWNKYAPLHDKEQIPYIVAVLDEYADLVDTCKEISQPVVSIAQKARACGIHMLISTQRPSTNVITGVIKGNLPTHVALLTANYTDSMTIVGEGGAEKLNGRGDMLVQSPLVSKSGLVRLQGCFIQGHEISRIVGYLKEHYETHYDENFLDLVDHAKEAGQQKVASGEVLKEADDAEEEKYQSIKEWVMTQAFVSMSKIQRECAVGFNRAGRFFNRLQKEGIVSTQQDGATKGCKVLVHDDYGSDLDVTSDELTSY